MEKHNKISKKRSSEASNTKSISVQKVIPVDIDLGMLLATDTNDLDTKSLSIRKNEYLLQVTRDNTQLLINELFQRPLERVEESIMAKLPKPKTLLPRRMSVPKPRQLTKWQQFAAAKGITKKKKPKATWDEELKRWIPAFGYRRAMAEKDKNWVLEVPQNADPNEDQFAKKLTAKSENVAKNELQRLRNIAKSRNIKVPRVGVASQEVSSSADLQAAVTIARASTASLGKFQEKLPKEKEARGVAAITPGASRKRKLPPVSGDVEKSENLNIVDAILNKRPKLNIETAVAKQIHSSRLNLQDDFTEDRKKGDNKSKSKSKISKKPKGGKGQRTGGKKGAAAERGVNIL